MKLIAGVKTAHDAEVESSIRYGLVAKERLNTTICIINRYREKSTLSNHLPTLTICFCQVRVTYQENRNFRSATCQPVSDENP